MQYKYEVRRIEPAVNKKEYVRNSVLEAFEQKANGLIFVGAAGIAVRYIAPYVQDKYKDPFVIVIDEKGSFVIPILSGHVGGGNEMALLLSNAMNRALPLDNMADLKNTIPVITTATDINDCFAVDVFAKNNSYALSDRELAKKVSASLLQGENIGIIGDWEGETPRNLVRIFAGADAQKLCEIENFHKRKYKYYISIATKRIVEDDNRVLYLIPRRLYLGVGCKRDTEPDKLMSFVRRVFMENNLFLEAVAEVATIDLKKNELAVTELAKKLSAVLKYRSAKELAKAEGDFCKSDFVMKVTGVDNVCERSAALSACQGECVVKRTASEGMTISVWEA